MINLPILYLATGLASLLLAFAAMPLLTRLAQHVGLVDEPGIRKVHSKPVPLTGGTQMFLATTLVTLAALIACRWLGPNLAWERQVFTVLVGGMIVFGTGLLDDFFDVRSKYKLLVLLGASAALCGSGLTLDGIYFGGKSPIHFGIFAWPITMLWIASVAIAINFIDGLDGLAGSLLLIAAAVLACMLLVFAGPSASTIVTLALVGSILAFLATNRHPAKQFMGDSGSLYLGFMVGSLTVIAAHQIGTARGLMVPALALSIPLTDTALTLFRRHFIQRRSMFSAERGHIHHRLMDMGLNQVNTVRVILGVTLLAVAIGYTSLLGQGWSALGVLALSAPVVLGLFHIAGSARGSTLVSAVKTKRNHDREASAYRRNFDEVQLQFNQVKTFDQWWDATSSAASKLDFVWVNLPLRNRDGSERIMRWNRPEPVFNHCEALSVTVPVEQRRVGGPLRMEVEVAAPSSLESAGLRIALFSRLMEEHAIAKLPNIESNQSEWFDAEDREPDPAPAQLQSEHQHIDAQPAHTSIGNARPLTPTHNLESMISEPVLPNLRVAIVHDFLYTYAGAERVLEQIVGLFPHADLFSLFDFLPDDKRHFILNKPVKTSFLQKLPMARTKHRAYLPLMPLAIEQLDVSQYDLVITSSYMAAKGVITGPNQLHICYCHSPVRYAWDLQHQYLDESKLGYSPKGLLARAILHYIRNWDARSAAGVDHFVANSRFIARRIEKLYRRESAVIYPPVSTSDFQLQTQKEEFYVTASRLVPYKRIDLIVEAFNQMPDKRLIVVGGGPDLERIRAIAGKNVRVLGHQPFKRMRRYFQMAKGFVFAAQEDFGIVPVEAMACGTPVIAFGQGGVTETVRHGETGILFPEQTAQSICNAIEEFEQTKLWPAARIRSHAMSFDAAYFRANLAGYIQHAWKQHTSHVEEDHPVYTPPAQPTPEVAKAATNGESRHAN